MPTPFKDFVGETSVRALAAAIVDVDPTFAVEPFVSDALDGLGGLELKARVAHVADALAAHLPGGFASAATLLADAAESAELGMWEAWPATEYVGRHGLADPDHALDALARLTRHASAEFAVRPYLERRPELALARVEAWSRSNDEHVRRLASEGTRPRLPWGPRLRALQADPTPVLPILDRLRDDRSEYVRRSVANSLGDIAKDHPELAITVARRWVAEGGQHVRPLVRHAMRSLVKRGDADALSLVGAHVDAQVEVRGLEVDPSVRIGDALGVRFTVVSQADAPVHAVVDYAVHHAGARGRRAPKVFAGVRRDLDPGQAVPVVRRHSFRVVTTRTYHPGRHAIDVLVNGRVGASAEFDLLPPQ